MCFFYRCSWSCFGSDSLKVVTGYVEPALGEAKAGDHFQFERTGYFVCDSKLVFNRTCSLKDSYKPA